MSKVKIIKLAHAKDLALPKYETKQSVGADLRAAIDDKDPITLKVGKYALIPTGIKIELPTYYEAQIRPRSGLALKYGITILNSPGTIDTDYRGEIKVILINLGDKDFTINHGDRIAQITFNKYEQVIFETVNIIEETERGEGGFGSTGT